MIRCFWLLFVLAREKKKKDPTAPRRCLIQLLQLPSPETMETVAMMMSLEDPQAEKGRGEKNETIAILYIKKKKKIGGGAQE